MSIVDLPAPFGPTTHVISPAGTSIETLQWLLAIGRVVSPVDALLNATGAVLAASWVTRSRDGRARTALPRRDPAHGA